MIRNIMKMMVNLPSDEKEDAWELYRLSKNYLETSEKNWQLRKTLREKEVKKKERLEEAKQKWKENYLGKIEDHLEKHREEGAGALEEVEDDGVAKNKKNHLQIETQGETLRDRHRGQFKSCKRHT